ncbi:MAG: ATPase, T2SS/T4P/T4SS family [Thermodesulfobacteriota bacterium]|nr:ATPase, T2SS/T4P/T4SS family [Thermodesulfobacteriota bacterium]
MFQTTTLPTDPVRIGDCLVQEGFATPRDILDALHIQQKEKKRLRFSQESVLPPINGMSKNQRKELLSHPPLGNHVGRICLERGLIDKKQLQRILRKKKSSELTGEVLVREGILTTEIIEEVLCDQLGIDGFGELAVKLNFLSPSDIQKDPAASRPPRTVGEILCEAGVINPVDLDYVLKKYGKQLKFGEILVKQGVIDYPQLRSALQAQFHQDKPLGMLLLEEDIITEDQLYNALATQYHIPFRKIQQLDFNGGQCSDVTRIVGPRYAVKNKVLPIAMDGDRMTLAVYNPEFIWTAEDIQKVHPNLIIKVVFITHQNFLSLFEMLYQRCLTDATAGKDTKKVKIDVNTLQIRLDETAQMADTASKADYGLSNLEVLDLVNYIIKYGIGNNASDIHIEQDRRKPRLRYRIDGILHTLQMNWLEEKLTEQINAVISRIKIISRLDIAEKRIPQDGVFRVNYYDPANNEQVDMDFRVATCPGIIGENVTIRILDPREAKVDIETLNHSPHVLRPLKKLLKSPAGMILVTGPTGSGKTSTLYSALQYIYSPTIKIITAEDPIEYSFPGIMQTQTNTKIDLTFPKLLRSFLRLDPDVVLVGEIRDPETARMSFDAAQTGHLLLSTLHTNDSAGAIPRLQDLGIDTHQMASCLMGVLAQRLLRKNCPACSVRYPPAEKEWTPLFDDYPDHLQFYRGEGCPSCNYTGFQGRTLISEFLVITPDIALALNRGASIREIKEMALAGGMRTMLDDGIAKLEKTTLQELLRVIPSEMLQSFRSRQKD